MGDISDLRKKSETLSNPLVVTKKHSCEVRVSESAFKERCVYLFLPLPPIRVLGQPETVGAEPGARHENLQLTEWPSPHRCGRTLYVSTAAELGPQAAPS